MSSVQNRVAVEAARENYIQWVRTAHTGAFLRRTAERNAAFFLPYLKPGMVLLDGGCGPGAITLGLAKAVAPGHVTGVDVDSNSLEIARNLAVERGTENVSFELHHLRALPYEDATFDAAFLNAVLQHVDEPIPVLREVLRVLKPGGVIGLADADFDGGVFWPETGLINRSTEVLAAVRTEGNARVGKQLRGLLAEAGFERCVGMAVGGAEGDPMTTAYNGEFWAKRFEEEPFVAYAEASGVSTRAEMAEISAAWRRWGVHPGAYAARFWCQAIGFKP